MEKCCGYKVAAKRSDPTVSTRKEHEVLFHYVWCSSFFLLQILIVFWINVPCSPVFSIVESDEKVC